MDSAPGPSGLRPTHLKEDICCPSPSVADSCLHSLAHFTSLLSSGLLPQEVAPHLCGASLLASHKKSGGLRPIAIGEMFRRLVSKCLSFLALPKARDLLPPLQVGVGLSNSAEAIIH